MKTRLKGFFAKILIIPAIFSFALACCHPLFAEAAEPIDGHVQIQKEISITSGPVFQDSHHCNHSARHEQVAVQSSTRNIASDLVLASARVFAISFYQYPTVDSSFIALPRITGPPWDGKSIKAFLGVYRS